MERPRGSAEDPSADSPQQPKSRSGSECLGLSRCAACYNQKANSMSRRGGDGESSSSAEDSGPEVDNESEAESSSSSSCSEPVAAETPEKPETEKHSPVCGDAAEPESGGEDGDKEDSDEEDGDGQKERGHTSEREQDPNRTKGMIRRAPLVKSFSLPPSFTPRLIPLSLLPRPPTIVSTLHLQVLPEKRKDDTVFTIRQHLSEREDEKTEEGYGGRGGGRLGSMNNLLLPQPFQWEQMGLPWQQRSQPPLQQHQYQQQQQHQLMSYQYQEQQPQHFPPPFAQGQGLPPPPSHTLPVLHTPTLYTPLQAPNAPQTHLHALTPEPCWYCYRMQLPYTYWSHYSSGQLPR
ncbi:lateral signaling target protein 2 homolog [Toxotes jaculatrix]|uniref:lateral signaling target protein 2 homolog n=1 Tax=Toxotes jaculatrix TaxID=941984 RepID=UPI001B3AC8A0|nr:lateral signaling target protein 2 homolog [Toxotes jaculatrix]